MNSPAGGFCAGGCASVGIPGLVILAGAGVCAGGVAGCPPGTIGAGGVPAGIIGSNMVISPPIQGSGCHDYENKIVMIIIQKINFRESRFVLLWKSVSTICRCFALERGCGLLARIFYLYFICHLIASVWLVYDVKR
jgi:hypothetical protein